MYQQVLRFVLLAHLVLLARASWADEVSQLVLVDASTNTDLFVLTNGAVVDLDVVGTALNVRADTTPAVTGSVRFDLDGVVNYRTENVAPYALEGDQNGDYAAATYSLGIHTVTATAFTGSGASGVAGPGLTVQFEIVGGTVAPAGDAPAVSAGADRFPSLPTTAATLTGMATAGSAPLDTITWTQVGGPGATIVDPTALSTDVLGLLPEAVCVFRLTVTDTDGRSATDDVLVSALPTGVSPGVVTGDTKLWHKITVTFTGPTGMESGSPSPFLDYRLFVSFSQGDRSILVPGYFAADGDSGFSGADSGDQWRAHFTPDSVGDWSYVALFRSGPEAAVSSDLDSGTPVVSVNGARGTVTVADTDAVLPDLRARGTLRHVGERYLRFAGDGSPYLKGGADSPENFLAYVDFDNTFDNNGSFLHAYGPHVQDWQPGDPEWGAGQGHGIIGAINYLASEGMNSIYFLTMNVNGDGDDVWPWTGPTERLQYDVSKLAQWEIVFEHMTRRGILLHVITQETENDQLLNGGALGTERRLYYRELVARFGHHPALVWNLGEENTNTNAQRQEFADWIRGLDPYDHPIVVHTFPGQQNNVWTPLLGLLTFDGASIQTSLNQVHNLTKSWIDQSAAAGRPWAVFLDEIGPANVGVVPDSVDPEHNNVRQQGLWGNLIAGGAGCEWYFGYGNPNNDLNCEDWRSRDILWDQTRYALEFFQQYLPFTEMQSADGLVTSGDATCLAKVGEVYAVYLESGGTSLELTAGTYTVDWYDPRNGGALIPAGTVTGPGTVPLPASPNPSDDWVALVQLATTGMPRVLICYETAGFNHAQQITAGLSMFTDIANQDGYELVTTGDSAGFFTAATLATFDAIVFLNTSGNILDNSEQQAFEDFMAAGGAFVGIHSATDTEYGWPFYGAMLGAWFACHPPGTTPARLIRETDSHPSTQHLSANFSWVDEWYNFQSNPSFDPETTLLVTIDESTYSGGLMGDPHPISWAREIFGGRVWYTAMGHNVATYGEAFFIDHVRGGLLWALSEGEGEFRRGDVNADGAVDLADAIANLLFLFSGLPFAACSDAADVNDDGSRDLSDPVTLLDYLFGSGPTPIAPFPDCGVDPTPDMLPCELSATCP